MEENFACLLFYIPVTKFLKHYIIDRHGVKPGPDLPLSGLKAEPQKWPEHDLHWSGPPNFNCFDKLESKILYSAGVMA